MQSQRSTKDTTKPSVLIDITASVAINGSVSMLLNPIDRAICLKTVHNRAFFLRANFTMPYHGAMQAMGQRLLGGAYHAVQGPMRTYSQPFLREQGLPEPIVSYITGLTCGFVHGAVTHPMAFIKIFTWLNPPNNFSMSVQNIYRVGGATLCFRGVSASILRDMVHGSTYEVMRMMTRNQVSQYYPDGTLPAGTKFVCDMAAAYVGTALSSPFNHARTLKFKAPLDQKAPTIPQVLKEVWQESTAHKHKWLGRTRFFQDRFNISIGTARAGFGMALIQGAFDLIHDHHNKPRGKQ